MHLIIFFVTYAVRLNLLVVNAHERTRTNHIETSVQFEKLQCSGAIGTHLQLIKEKQCFTRNKLKRRIEQRDVFENRIHLKAVIEDLSILYLLYKIYLDNMLIMLGRKKFYGASFPDLASPFHDKRLPIRIAFPRHQISIYLSFEQLFHI